MLYTWVACKRYVFLANKDRGLIASRHGTTRQPFTQSLTSTQTAQISSQADKHNELRRQKPTVESLLPIELQAENTTCLRQTHHINSSRRILTTPPPPPPPQPPKMRTILPGLPSPHLQALATGYCQNASESGPRRITVPLPPSPPPPPNLPFLTTNPPTRCRSTSPVPQSQSSPQAPPPHPISSKQSTTTTQPPSNPLPSTNPRPKSPLSPPLAQGGYTNQQSTPSSRSTPPSVSPAGYYKEPFPPPPPLPIQQPSPGAATANFWSPPHHPSNYGRRPDQRGIFIYHGRNRSLIQRKWRCCRMIRRT